MITVYVWLPRQVNNEKQVGHASLLVNGHTYISWWPDETAGPVGDYHPIRNKNFASDVRDEGCSPDAAINLHGLDEAAILQWWQSFGLVSGGTALQGPLPPYNLLQKNCSTVVAMALKTGGADRYASWYYSWSAFWRPQTVFDFANSIQQGLSKET